MAPECLCDKAYNMKADVYSFAVILWEILTGRTPYGFVRGRSHLIHQIVEENVRPTIDESWPSSIQGFLEDSFDSEIGKRPVSKSVPHRDARYDEILTLIRLFCVIIKKMALWFDFIGKELACLRGGDYSKVRQSFVCRRRSHQSVGNNVGKWPIEIHPNHRCPRRSKHKSCRIDESSCVGSRSCC